MENLNGWIDIQNSGKFPDEDKPVWLYNINDNEIHTGEYVFLKNEGFLWAISNGSLYIEDGVIQCDSYLDDFIPTHWRELPKLPEKLKQSK